MKRLLATILAVLYMANAFSLTVHVHYCMGGFAGIRIIDKEEEVCGKCGMKKCEKNRGCCKDDHKTFKANDHQRSKASFDFSHQQIATVLQHHFFATAELVTSHRIIDRAVAHAPPSVWRTCPIYLLNLNFRI